MDYYFSKRISGLQPSAIREILKATQDPAIIPFAAGNPDAASFPIEEVKKVEKPVVKEVETREEKAIETPELPKEKKTKKK